MLFISNNVVMLLLYLDENRTCLAIETSRILDDDGILLLSLSCQKKKKKQNDDDQMTGYSITLIELNKLNHIFDT